MPGPLPTEPKYFYMNGSTKVESGLGGDLSGIILTITGLTVGSKFVINISINNETDSVFINAHTGCTYDDGGYVQTSAEKVYTLMRVCTATDETVTFQCASMEANASFIALAYQA